ncbi:MAG: hypothetical protein AAGI23_09575 [Bacteroidota bacterium]
MNNHIIIFGKQGSGKSRIAQGIQTAFPEYQVQDECTAQTAEILIRHCWQYKEEKWILVSQVHPKEIQESFAGFTIIRID